jgi:two-component system sensor histidine kinase/response regulator
MATASRAATPPRLVRSLLWRMSAAFLAGLLVFGGAIQFLIVVPTSQALARTRLDLAVTQIRSEAERNFQRIETQLRTARAWSEARQLSVDDAAGFTALLAPLLAGDAQIAAIHLADTDGRGLTLEAGGGDAHHDDPVKTSASRPWFTAALDSAAGDNVGWTAPYRLAASGEGVVSVFARWHDAGRPARILAFDIRLADLPQLAVDSAVGTAGGSVLITDDGAVVGLPQLAQFADLDARRSALLKPAGQIDVDFVAHGYARWLSAGDRNGGMLAFENAGTAWFAQFAPLQLGGQRWWVGRFARSDDLIPTHLRDLAPVLVLLIALSAAATAGLARRLAQRIEAALAALVERSERIGRLDLAPAEPLNAPWREIAELADSQERMRKHLSDATHALSFNQAELEEKVSQRTHQLADQGRALADQLLFVQELLDVLPNPVFYKGPDARYLGCNRAFEEAFGTHRDFLVGKTVLELPFVPEALRRAHHAADLHTIASNGSLHKEIRLPFADGREHDTLYWARSFRRTDGEPGGILGALVDITPQKAAEREARAAEEWIRRILESSPIAVVINRPGGRPLFVNSRAPELVGTDLADFLQHPVTSWFRSHEVVESVVADTRAGKPIRDQEVEFRHTNGSSLWALVTLEKIAFQGSPALIGWGYDITRRKVAEQELRKLSLAVEQSPSMLVITLPDGTIQYANPRFCQETGRRPEELAGTRPELLDAAGRPCDFHSSKWQPPGTGDIWRRECQLRRRDGEPLWVGVSVSGLTDTGSENDSGITHCVWVLEDLSMHRQALQTLRDAKRVAEDAAESGSRFLANMSHEIRTPLNAIIGLAELCRNSGLDARQHDYVTKIQAAGATLLGVVNNILDFSKIEAGKLHPEKTPFDLDRVLDNVTTFVAQKAREKGLELHVDIKPDVPRRLVGDPLRLGQVLTNLLSNAVKFTEQGEVRLQIDAPDAAAPAGQASLHFEVCDTGIGMDAAQMDALFDAFAQADNSTTRRYGGTGLGLSIARHLVELMGGGPFHVDSAPGAGSRFGFSVFFELATSARPDASPPVVAPIATPVAALAAAQEPPRRAPAPQVPSPQLTGLRVLVVEDNAINRQIACGLLEHRGAVVHMADNGRVAVDTLRLAGPHAFDIVLMDLRMPEMDGFEATTLIRQDNRFADLPIIAITAHALAEERQRCLDTGMNDHVAKPIVPEILFETILRHVKHTNGIGTLPELPGLDVVNALRRANNKPDFYLSLLRRFVASQADCAARIDAALTAGRSADAERLTHTLRGTAASLGAKPLSETAAALESALAAGAAPSAARRLVAPLAAELAALVGMLENALPPAPPETEEPTAALSPAEFDAALARLVALVRSADGAAPSAFRQLRATLATHIGSKICTQIGDALLRYDYDDALTYLNRALDPGRTARPGDPT